MQKANQFLILYSETYLICQKRVLQKYINNTASATLKKATSTCQKIRFTVKRIFLYIPQSPNLTLKGGMPCILPMAIIGLLKVSCEGRRAATKIKVKE